MINEESGEVTFGLRMLSDGEVVLEDVDNVPIHLILAILDIAHATAMGQYFRTVMMEKQRNQPRIAVPQADLLTARR